MHLFVHSDKKMYECAVCGQGFMRRPLLLGHMQRMEHMSNQVVINKLRVERNGEDPAELVLESVVQELQERDLLRLNTDLIQRELTEVEER